MNPAEIAKFHNQLFEWWEANRRDLPWRRTDDPYFIMVSEFMLQQTQVSRVIPKYLEFVATYPTLEALSQATKSKVISIWQGLGYNRRAIWLQEAAVELAKHEEFPQEPKTLQNLKGIGPYTSRAIPIFAFNKDVAAVDTNIRRVLIHHGFVNPEQSKREVQQIADKLVPTGRSRDYHNALMDYGSLKLTARETKIQPRTTQSQEFKGSNRQTRGQIIKYLVDHGQATRMELEKLIDQDNLSHNITNLIADGMIIEITDGVYRLPS